MTPGPRSWNADGTTDDSGRTEKCVCTCVCTQGGRDEKDSR